MTKAIQQCEVDMVRFGREVLGITSSTLLVSKLLDQTSDNYLLEGSVGSFDRQDAVEQLLLLVVCIAIPSSHTNTHSRPCQPTYTHKTLRAHPKFDRLSNMVAFSNVPA